MTRIRQNKNTVLLPFVLCCILAFFGCMQDKNARVGCTEGYVQAKVFLENYYDSLYANPEGLRVRLCRMQAQMPDSDGWYLLQAYKGFGDFIATGNDKAFFSANDSVLDYCARSPQSLNLKASCLNLRSIVLQTSDTDSAVSCLKQACQTLDNARDRVDQVLFLINMADIYRMTNRQVDASECFHAALAKSDSLRYEKMLVGLNMGLGQLYSDMNQFELAGKYFGIADSLLTKNERAVGRDTLPYPKDRFLLESAKGNSLYGQKEYEAALQCFQKAKRSADLLQNDFYSFNLYVNLSELYALTNQLDSAKLYMAKADSIEVRGINIDADFYCNTIAADIALRENNLAEAQRILSIPYDKQHVNKQYLQIRSRKLSEFYAKKGDYRQAYLYGLESDHYDDSIRNVQTQTNIAEMNMRYQRDTTLLNSRLIIAQHETRLSRKDQIVELCIVLLLVVIILGTYKNRQWRRRTEKLSREAQSKIIQLRMNAMYNRASPHLIFNAVNNAKGQYPEPIFDKLTDVLRDNLLLSDHIALPLSEELRTVKNYVELHELTHSAVPKVEFCVADDVDASRFVPAMCIQIPVENALKHAFREIKGGEKITVSITQKDRTVIAITDNGIGFQSLEFTVQGAEDNSTGNGLKLIFEEIQILNSLNQEKITFNITNNESNGSKTEITIPGNYEYIHNGNR